MSGISFTAPASFNPPGEGGAGAGSAVPVDAFGIPTSVSGAANTFGLPSGIGAASGSPAPGATAGWWQQAAALAENWGSRAAVIFLGVILVAVGAAALSRQRGG